MGLRDYYDNSSGGCALVLLVAAAAGLVPLLALVTAIR